VSFVKRAHISSNISSFRKVDIISIPHELDGTGIVEEELALLPEKLERLEKLGRLAIVLLSILSLLDILCRKFNLESSWEL
jgi:hypothetical protein